MNLSAARIASVGLAGILGVSIGFLAGAAVMPVASDSMMAGVLLSGSIVAIGYLVTRDSISSVIRDGLYGLGVVVTALLITANLDASLGLVKVGTAIVAGALVAGVGHVVGMRETVAEIIRDLLYGLGGFVVVVFLIGRVGDPNYLLWLVVGGLTGLLIAGAGRVVDRKWVGSSRAETSASVAD